VSYRYRQPSEPNATERPPDGDRGLESQRKAFDVAQEKTRSKTDRFRLDQRFIRDGTRHNQRGDLQAQESLRRERQAEDDGVLEEREHSDFVRREEHKLSDVTLRREKEAREHAEEASREGLDRESGRALELIDVLGLVQAQLLEVSTNLGVLLPKAPEGEFMDLLAHSFGAVRRAAVRVQSLVADVLDPGDARCRHHEVGGEGG